jgi:Flp pilus assembly protein TadG
MNTLSDEHGSLLVAGLLFTIALLMAVGASVDLGRAFIARRELSALADQAALSGAQQLDLTTLHQGRLALNPTNAVDAADQALTGQTGLTVQISAGSASVDIRLQRRLITVFLPLLGINTLTLNAAAVATPQRP